MRAPHQRERRRCDPSAVTTDFQSSVELGEDLSAEAVASDESLAQESRHSRHRSATWIPETTRACALLDRTCEAQVDRESFAYSCLCSK